MSAAPRSRAPDVSIVVALFNHRAVSERFLRSLDCALGERLGSAWELVLVDNASTDSTPRLLDRWAERAVLVRHARNENVAGGWHAGVLASSGRVLAICNNDLEVASGSLERLVESAEEPDVGLVGARLRYPNGALQHGGFGFHRHDDGSWDPFHYFHHEGPVAQAGASYDVQAVSGAVLVLRREIYDRAGGVDTGYVNGWEDVDLAFRVRALDLRVVYRGDVEIVHHEGTTSGAGRYGAANRERFAARWGSAVEDDRQRLRALFGAQVRPLLPVGGTAVDGAVLSVEGAVATIAPEAAEARALVAGLAAAGVDVAARQLAQPFVVPRLDPAATEELDRALARPRRPNATVLQVLEGGAMAGLPGIWVARVAEPAAPPAAHPPAAVWAASRRCAAELVELGHPEGAVAVLPPFVPERALGTGGDGVLAILPAHAADLSGRIADAVARRAGVPVVQAWTVPPSAQDRRAEEVLREGSWDAVVDLDPGDAFGRRALEAAAGGAAVVVLPDGPTADVLGELAATCPADARPEAIATALGAALERGDRAARAAAVAARCGTAAWGAAVARLRDRVPAAPPPRPSCRWLLVAARAAPSADGTPAARHVDGLARGAAELGLTPVVAVSDDLAVAPGGCEVVAGDPLGVVLPRLVTAGPGVLVVGPGELERAYGAVARLSPATRVVVDVAAPGAPAGADIPPGPPVLRPAGAGGEAPPAIPPPLASHVPAPDAARSGALVLGDFRIAADRAALQAFLADVLPLLRERGWCQPVGVAGPGLDATLSARTEAVGAVALGVLPDAAAELDRWSLVVSPPAENGRPHDAVLAALGHGLPLVCAPAALAGIDPGRFARVAEGPAALADAIAGLADGAAWRAAADDALQRAAWYGASATWARALAEALA